MESKNLLTLAITLTVGIILAGSLLMPVLNDATTVNETFDNSGFGYYQMKELESGDNWTRSDGVWTYNGETLTSSSESGISIVVTDTGTVRQNGQTRSTVYTTNNTSTADIVTVNDVDVLKINTNNTISYESGYGATPAGDYILKTYTDKAYVHGDTFLWVTGATGLATGGANNVIIHIEGSINDGLTITAESVYNGTVSNIEVGDYTINYSPVQGFKDLYQIENVTFDITGDVVVDGNTETSTVAASYSTFILPKEITAERAVHFNSGEIAILNALPILIIVALVVMAAGALYLKRDD